MSEGCLERADRSGDGALAPILDRASFEAAQARLGGEGEAKVLGSRRALARSALELSGEVGYRALPVGALVGRAGANRDRFYRAFSSKEECWLEAYRAGGAELCDRLLVACANGGYWAKGL